jgi:hypothetical protein
VTHVPEVNKDRYRKQARAALRSIGVPIKGGMKP